MFKLATDTSTDFFLELQLNGIYTNITTYENSNTKKKVIYMPMIHLAEREFYENLSKEHKLNGSVYLLEGVKDNQNLFTEEWPTIAIAKRAELEVQSIDNLDKCEVTKKMYKDEYLSKCKKNIYYLNADVDISEFDERTIKHLKYLSKISKDGFARALYRYKSLT